MATTLYKYASDFKALENMIKGRVKFTLVADLNDPSEMEAVFDPDAVRASLEHIRRHGHSEEDVKALEKQAILLKRLNQNGLGVAAPSSAAEADAVILSPVYNDLDLLQKQFERFVHNLRDKLGMFCLSSCYNSLPMWAHYASNAKGFVVEFTNLQDVFPGDETEVLNSVKRVGYDKVSSVVTFRPASAEHVFFQKLSDWSYENEFRVLRPVEDCELVSLENGHIHYIHEIPPEHVSKVILGWKLTGEEKEHALGICRNLAEKGGVFQASYRRNTVELSPVRA